MKRGRQVTAQVTGKYGNKGHHLIILAVYIFTGCAKDTMKRKTILWCFKFGAQENKRKKKKRLCNVLDVRWFFLTTGIAFNYLANNNF